MDPFTEKKNNRHENYEPLIHPKEFLMQGKIRLFLLSFAALIASCQLQPAPHPSLTILLPAAAPTQTAPSFANPTPTQTLAPGFRQTYTPQPLSTAPHACFIINGIPQAFMGDNDHLLYQGESGLQVVDLAEGQSTNLFPKQVPAAMSGSYVALSPAGDRLSWALSDNTIRVYQVSDRTLLHTLKGHTNIITEMEYSPDGEKLYTASHDTWVRVWDRDGKEVGAFQPTGADNIPNEVLGMGLSRDGRMLATIPFDGKVKIWDAQTFILVRELGAYGGYDNADAVFSPDDQYLAAITANGLFLWKVADGRQILGGNPGINAMALAFSPDGRYLVYWDIEGTHQITFLSVDGAETIRTLPAGEMMVWKILFSPDSSLIVAASDTETRIWRMSDGEWLYQGKPECP
jgi:WD40 repeat protein